jgi:methyltransferase (TIGR00027 family)
MRHRDTPSQTAIQVALCRAAHQLYDRPKVLDDPLALRILGPGGALALLAASPVHFSAPARQWRAFLVARSRIVEDELALAVQRGVRQYVVLGAGLDTFACRNPYPAAKLQVFEVDKPATQAFKRERLADAGIVLPPSVHFVPVDFEGHALAARLRRAGFDADEPAFFSWLGVSMYLSAPAVMQMLGLVAASPKGSAIVFDYLVPLASLGSVERWSAQATGAMVALAGEPWRSHFDPVALAKALRGLGFSQLNDMDARHINMRFFNKPRTSLQAGPVTRVMHAVV